MKASEMTAHIGRTGSLTVAGTRLRFTVRVTDARERFGQLDYLVTPVAGGGEAWHSSSLVTLDEVTA